MFNKALKADLLLLLAAFIWGSGFVAQRKGMDYVGPMTFTGLRFLLGGIVLLPVLAHQHLLKPTTRSPFGHVVPWSCLAGLMLFCGAALQQIGLVDTAAGKAGFITGLYVVIVALIGLFLGHKIGWAGWAGSFLAIVGMYFLSIKESFTMEKMNYLSIAILLVISLHIAQAKEMNIPNADFKAGFRQTPNRYFPSVPQGWVVSLDSGVHRVGKQFDQMPDKTGPATGCVRNGDVDSGWSFQRNYSVLGAWLNPDIYHEYPLTVSHYPRNLFVLSYLLLKRCFM